MSKEWQSTKHKQHSASHRRPPPPRCRKSHGKHRTLGAPNDDDDNEEECYHRSVAPTIHNKCHTHLQQGTTVQCCLFSPCIPARLFRQRVDSLWLPLSTDCECERTTQNTRAQSTFTKPLFRLEVISSTSPALKPTFFASYGPYPSQHLCSWEMLGTFIDISFYGWSASIDELPMFRVSFCHSGRLEGFVEVHGKEEK